MGRKLGLLLLFMAVAFAEACHAAFDGNRPYVVNYARDKYRAANKNWAVEQDERGVMYVGNDAGLLVSDGMEWDLYPMPGVPIVRALAVESHNTIYVGGTDELGRWDRDRSGRLRYTSLKKLLPGQRPDNESFWRVHIDGDTCISSRSATSTSTTGGRCGGSPARKASCSCSRWATSAGCRRCTASFTG